MYEELFHSVDRPFRATPDPKFYYPHESIETARQTAVRAVLRAEGPVMVLGGAGLGKSLLGMVIADDLSARFDVVKLHAARLCSRRALLQNILFELQLPYRDLSEGELRFSILDRLEPSSENAPDGILVVVDEAHTLPIKLLDELRIITNFTRNNQPRARLVLIGNLRLEHTFAEPQMESFNQRLAARCYLQPMNRQQTYTYIKHQLQIAGVNPRELITEDAVNTVYAASEGVPRLSNQIMDHALVLAITRAQCPVSSALIEEAWSDLQQLPAPWHSGTDKFGTNTTGHSASVEFGSLDDDEDLNQELQLDTSSVQVVQQLVQHSEPVRSSGDENDYQLAPEEDELGFADDQPSETAERTNYFTAFAPADDEFSVALDLPVGKRIAEQPHAAEGHMPTGDNGEVSQIPNREVPLLVRPRVFFDAPENIDYSTVDQSNLSIDSFFANRPTDELLIAYQDEQDQFDLMGVWENDPPLAAIAPGTHRDAGDRLVETADFANGVGKSETIQPTNSPRSLFGDDFDEEIPVSPKPSSLNVAAGLEPRQTAVDNSKQPDDTTIAAIAEGDDTAECLQSAATAKAEGYSARQAAEAADYVARIQEYADALRRANQQSPQASLPTVEEVLSHVQSPLDIAPGQGPETWTFDVASLDIRNEVAVHNEIEDLVSQLNFAAFATEPYSVEQISLEPQDQRDISPPDSVRYGQNEEIYTLHRPQESTENEFNGWTVDESSPSDDDRDLLIVEEDLPASTKVVNETETPVTKIAPYSQLFAKLRK